MTVILFLHSSFFGSTVSLLLVLLLALANSLQLPVVPVELTYDHSLRLKETDAGVQPMYANLFGMVTFHYGTESINGTRREIFLSKPWRLRLKEFDEPKTSSVEVIEELHHIRFNMINLNHQGPYSFYQFYFEHDNKEDDSHGSNQTRHVRPLSSIRNGRLVHYTRRDFYLVVHGLKHERAFCLNNEECISGSCHPFNCICNDKAPIFANQTCIETKDHNEHCQHHDQCRYYGGPKAECRGQGTASARCQCQPPWVPIKISDTRRHCVRTAELGMPCTFSKQCSLLGENRFCNGTYHCDCLPGFVRQKDGTGHHCFLITLQSSSSALIAVPQSSLTAMIIILMIMYPKLSVI